MAAATAIVVSKPAARVNFALLSLLTFLTLILADCDGEPVAMAARAVLGG